MHAYALESVPCPSAHGGEPAQRFLSYTEILDSLGASQELRDLFLKIPGIFGDQQRCPGDSNRENAMEAIRIAYGASRNLLNTIIGFVRLPNIADEIRFKLLIGKQLEAIGEPELAKRSYNSLAVSTTGTPPADPQANADIQEGLDRLKKLSSLS